MRGRGWGPTTAAVDVAERPTLAGDYQWRDRQTFTM